MGRSLVQMSPTEGGGGVCVCERERDWDLGPSGAFVAQKKYICELIISWNGTDYLILICN